MELLAIYFESILCWGEWRSRNDGMEGRHCACKASTLLLSFNTSLSGPRAVGLGHLFIYTLGFLICVAGVSQSTDFGAQIVKFSC